MPDTTSPVGLLRFLTCGSVDDGKSTLIGRLLFDSKLIMDDQYATLARDSARYGTTGDEDDLALLVDGLQAEREQGITIDVAYRFITTPRRRFIVADTPGHEQYTRNMATGASTADVAIVLVDARHGVVTQTARHSMIASLLGIRHILLAVNKIDLVGFDPDVFARIVSDYREATAELGFADIMPIPISARYGDNVTAASENTPWYTGPSLLSWLETVEVDSSAAARPFRMHVQWVNRPNLDFRGYSGTIASGTVRAGDPVALAGSQFVSHVVRIVTADGDLADARAGDAVTVVLSDELDISRGDVLTSADHPLEVADQFQAHMVWLNEAALVPGRTYLVKLGTALVSGSITRIRHRIDINTREKLSAENLALNDVGVVNLSLQYPVAFEPFKASRALGGFIVIDRQSNATVGVGMIDYALTRASNLAWQKLHVDKSARSTLKQQKPVVLWFTGLSGSGKSTIANLVEQKLHARGQHTYVLDGDNVRHGLNRDLGFTEADRVENIRRVGEVASLFVDAGLIVLVSFISPYRAERRTARELVGEDEFLEVYVDTPIEECRRRDPKGLYQKADQGLIKHFTGIDAPYEAPDSPDIHLLTTQAPPEAMADQVIAQLRRRGIIV
jgi:bifunctional enzyme CysN/CysC